MELSIGQLEIKDNSKFLKLEEGANVIRIVSGFKMRVVTFKDGTKSTKYSCLVINRKDGEIRLADFGKQIIKQLKTLASSKDYGFTDRPKYDITIVKEGTGFETTYTVTPARQDSALTAEEENKIYTFGSLTDFLNKLEENKPVTVDDLNF